MRRGYNTGYGGAIKPVTGYWLVDFRSRDMAPTVSSDIMGSDVCDKATDFVVSFFSDYVSVACILGKIEIHVVLEILCFSLIAIDLDKSFRNH